MRVSTNIASLNAQRNFTGNNRALQKNMSQLASGSRINIAADDAAGLAISENLKSYIRSNRQAWRNTQDGVSLIETAEGAFNEVGKIVTRLRELGIQAASDTIGQTERGFVNLEAVHLKQEIDRIADVTTWVSTKLLDGSSPQFAIQVGIFANPEDNAITFDPSENNVKLAALGIEGLDFATKEGAQQALALLDKAGDHLNGARANLGALQNRLVSAMDSLGVSGENMAAANSRIRDTDVAVASSEMVRNNILLQAGASTLTQANSVNGIALKLIA